MTLRHQTSPHGTLLALSTMKDEGPGVIEWVAHHLAIGFTDVLVYTNDCSDGTDLILKRLQALDIGVHHRDNVMPPGIKPHPSMLKHAHDEPLVRASDWVLVLDADEFLCITHPSATLDGLVSALGEVGADAIVITWRIFGSNGVRDWSRAPVTDQFTRAAPPFWNKGWGVKTMLKFDHRYLRLGMHRPIIKSQHKESDYSEKVVWVNGSGKVLEEWFKFRGWRSIRRTVGFDWAQINHYALKSMDAYALRKFRGNANLKKDKYNADYWALQDRNEVEDLSIARHAARRAEIMAELLTDPELARLHDAAHARAEARLATLKGTDDWQTLVASFVEAAKVPLSEVVAKPPKARDPAAVAAVQTKIEARRAALPKSERRTETPAGWGAGAASPYVAGPVDRAADVPLQWVDNQSIPLPVDPRLFTPAAMEAVQSGKFDRRHARNIGAYLTGAERFLDLGGGIGFVGRKAMAIHPALVVTVQDDRADLIAAGQQILARAPDAPAPGWIAGPLTPETLTGCLVRLQPDALRLPPDLLRPEALPFEALGPVNRLIVPLTDPAEAEAIRARAGASLAAVGLPEDPKGLDGGSLLFRRG